MQFRRGQAHVVATQCVASVKGIGHMSVDMSLNMSRDMSSVKVLLWTVHVTNLTSPGLTSSQVTSFHLN